MLSLAETTSSQPINPSHVFPYFQTANCFDHKLHFSDGLYFYERYDFVWTVCAPFGMSQSSGSRNKTVVTQWISIRLNSNEFKAGWACMCPTVSIERAEWFSLNPLVSGRHCRLPKGWNEANAFHGQSDPFRAILWLNRWWLLSIWRI